MTILWNRIQILAFDRKIGCTCVVRNLENKQRPLSQVVYSENQDGTQGSPYSPQVFPNGMWEIFTPIASNSRFMSPWFIPTNAHQLVDEWATEQDGPTMEYTVKTGRQVMDYGYGIHYSQAMDTLGCVRIAQIADVLFLKENIDICFTRNERVYFNVDPTLVI